MNWISIKSIPLIELVNYSEQYLLTDKQNVTIGYLSAIENLDTVPKPLWREIETAYEVDFTVTHICKIPNYKDLDNG